MRFADYMAAFNRYDDEALVRDFWTEDCVMQSGSRVCRGHQGMRDFLAWAHDGVIETMRPQAVIESGDRIFAEVDMDFTATRDRADFPFAPLSTGQTVTVKFFAHYLTRGGKVARLHTATWPTGVGVTSSEAGLLGGSPAQRQAYLAYARAFSDAAFDIFPAYYCEDVVLELPTTRLEGRSAIVDFYRDMFGRIRESVTIHGLVAGEDSLRADITSTFTCLQDAPTFGPMPLLKGQVMEIPLVVTYALRGGHICHIRGVRNGEPRLVTA
jgi:ketosteroid isomerase-like protein